MNRLSSLELLKLTAGFIAEWDKNFIHLYSEFRDVINGPRNDVFSHLKIGNIYADRFGKIIGCDASESATHKKAP